MNNERFTELVQERNSYYIEVQTLKSFINDIQLKRVTSPHSIENLLTVVKTTEANIESVDAKLLKMM